jgi:LmbE family N-acetylglucosaminyl deacetylase
LNYLYLSPQPDDAVFSCGGLIHQQRCAGDSVAVLTLCAGQPDYSRLSPMAQQLHAQWGNSPDLVGARRTEDQRVLASLGAAAFYGHTPDAIYRHMGDEIAYPDSSSLFSAPHPQELASLPPLWRQQVEGLGFPREQVTVIAPLAVSKHVDHQLTRALVLLLIQGGWQAWFCEDFHRAQWSSEAVQAARAWFGPVAWQSRTVLIDVEVKITAIRGYTTQVPALFGSDPRMAEHVKRYTADAACAVDWVERVRRALAGTGGRRERLWRALLGYHAHAERIWTWV